MSQDPDLGRLVPLRGTKADAYFDVGRHANFMFLCDSIVKDVIFRWEPTSFSPYSTLVVFTSPRHVRCHNISKY